MLVAGNWKMYKTIAEALQFVEAVRDPLRESPRFSSGRVLREEPREDLELEGRPGERLEHAVVEVAGEADPLVAGKVLPRLRPS